LVVYQGIWAPTPTPLTRSGNVDEKRIRLLVNSLIDGGIDGLFPLGTSGEFALLSRSERKSIVSAVADEAKGRVPVFAGCLTPV
jgi:4-hydroxy-tetrahydrodipicolinate synthase